MALVHSRHMHGSRHNEVAMSKNAARLEAVCLRSDQFIMHALPVHFPVRPCIVLSSATTTMLLQHSSLSVSSLHSLLFETVERDWCHHCR